MICGYNSVLINQPIGIVGVGKNFISHSWWRQTHGVQLVGGDCHVEGVFCDVPLACPGVLDWGTEVIISFPFLLPKI